MDIESRNISNKRNLVDEISRLSGQYMPVEGAK